MQAAGRWVMIVVIAVSLIGALGAPAAEAAPAGAPLLQSVSLAMTAPQACPPDGCAAGQRLSMRFSFDPAGYEPAQTPNVKVCVYAPISWHVSGAWVAANGEVTGAAYAARTLDAAVCDQNGGSPANYRLLFDQEATLGDGAFADAVAFSFRLGADATGSGVVLARLFVNNGGTWSAARSATGPTITLMPASSPSYVASDLATCGEYSPCYINSAGDWPGGIGTGLKDAVDAIPAGGTVYVLGRYLVRANTVVINRPVTVTGVDDATITYSGSSCGSSMLALQSAVTLRGLNINDGSCDSPRPDRGLLDVDSDETVLIESNDLNNGDNAISIGDRAGAVTVRFNEISGNKGFAIFSEGVNQAGPLEVTGNNLGGNTSLIECGVDAGGPLSFRTANHNHWGGGSPTSDATHCTINFNKRLGMPIQHKTGEPGVDGQLVQVTADKTYTFGEQVAYNRTGGSDFPLYIINHGYLSPNGPPFTYAQGGESPSPCSNYYDVYLPDEVTPGGTLELYLKYNKTAGCMAVINSSQYCDQTSNMGKYPLFWFDPSGSNGVTKWWDYTGAPPENQTSAGAQTTRCNIRLNEVQVSIDNSGRPNLNSDLSYTPLMVGVPVLRAFNLFASSQRIQVSWATNNEPDIDGFFVWRSLDGVNFTLISDKILHTGTALVGKSYFYDDPGRTNGEQYWYRLEIRRTDGSSIYSAILNARANVATITPTLTLMPTWTRVVIYATNTPTFTRVANYFPTRLPTLTATSRLFTPSATFLVLSTITPSPLPGDATGTALVEPTKAPADLGSTTPGPVDGMMTVTPSPNVLTVTPQPPGRAAGSPRPWLSLLLGLLSGLAAVGGLGGWWYYRLKR